jgi:methylated-DNA-[protein]-cysteine S-methyltransferase
VISYALFPTAIGTCGLLWAESGILGLQLPEATEALTIKRMLGEHEATETDPPAEIEAVIQSVQRLTEGGNIDLTQVPLDMSRVGSYNRRLYEAIRAIPPGHTRTYGEIATDMGEPGAARAVGRAMGQNPWPIIVPCHRVVAANGKTGGFSAYGGVSTKLRLLAIEQAHRSTDGALF